jgi:uncharacterized membrane protein YraQ (UPF0718 family)
MHTTDGAPLPQRPRGLGATAGALGRRFKTWRGRERAGAPGAVDWTREWKPLVLIISVFLLAYYLPIGQARFDAALAESLELTKWYAREHVLLCLVPAFYIAGAVAVFVNQGAVLRYLGPRASKPKAYGIASVSGSLLAVCSCTVLPLFAGIYQAGAGLGPATAFLYSGPAINVLAVILTARVLGVELGVARAIGAVAFAILVGLAMHFIFRRQERERADAWIETPEMDDARPLWQHALLFASLVGILVFANWGRPEAQTGVWAAIYAARWAVTGAFAFGLGLVLTLWFGLTLAAFAWLVGVTVLAALWRPEAPVIAFVVGTVGLSTVAARDSGEIGAWFASTWGFAKQILPLLLIGVLAAGLALGRPGHEGLIPSEWIAGAVGGNSLAANAFASVAGVLMYFATLTEVPILEGLLGNGMGSGPALALLLAGPALSLPSILVVRSVVGWKKTLVYVGLVAVAATISGLLYGALT